MTRKILEQLRADYRHAELIFGPDDPAVQAAGEEYHKKLAAYEKTRARVNANRTAKDDAYRSLGLTKVRGALGGTYWE